MFVVGFDGSKGRKRPGRADGCGLMKVTLGAPGEVWVAGYWPDPGVGNEWEPPKPDIREMVEETLSDKECVGGHFDNAGGWSEDIARWEAGEGLDKGWHRRKRTRYLSMSTRWKTRAWDVLYEQIEEGLIVIPDQPLRQELGTHLLAARNQDISGNVGKEHSGPRAQKIDLAAAMAYAVSARLEALTVPDRKSQYSGNAMF